MLDSIIEEIAWWHVSYREAAADTTAEWLQGRFLDRAAVLAELQHQLLEARHTLNGLPRLS
jgi:hypothetical protein